MKYFEGYKLKSILAILAKFIEAVFEVIIPLLMAHLIDGGIVNGDQSIVYRSVFWMALLSLLGYVSALVCQYYASHISQVIGGKIRSDLLRHDLSLATEYVDSFSSSVLTNRIVSDTLFIQDMIARVIRLGIRAPFLLVGTLTALVMIHPDLAIILLISIPFFVIVIAGFMYLTTKGHGRATAQLDRVSARIAELLSGTRIIRALSKQEHSDKMFNQDNELLAKQQMKVGFFATLSSPLTTVMMNAIMIVLIYVSGVNVNTGTMTQGQTLAVINYCSQLLITLIVSMNLIMIISRGMTSLKRVKQVLATQPQHLQDGQEVIAAPFVLAFDAVSFSYPGEKRRVLEDVSFKLEPGQSLGILGLTGSGKSTLLRLIPRLFEPSSGRITLNHHPLHEIQLRSLRDAIGYVPQGSQFLRGSLYDNVAMKRFDGVTQALLDAQGEDILAKGLDGMIEEAGKNLSGGQKQRVNIARALVKNPKLLIFDESFSALDALTTSKLQTVLKTKYASTSIIIASQRTSSVKHADWILVMDHGKIVDQGTHDSLIVSNDIYQRIDALQYGGVDL